MIKCLLKSRKQVKPFRKKLNNKGVTLAEMLVTFILLGIFMVAATRVISYTVGIYYATKGNTNGYQVSNMLYDKLSGEIENAVALKGEIPTVSENGTINLQNKDNNRITIGLTDEDSDGRKYLRITYAPTTYQGAKYNEVDWLYDPKVYLGYDITELKFEDPNKDSAGNEIKDSNGELYYDPNIIRMILVVNSPRYGEFKSTYYLKCYNCEKVVFKN